MSIVLGIDLGTSGVKALVVDEQCSVLASSFEGYELIQPRPGWSEQNPDDWWEAVISAIQKIMAHPQIEPSAIKALALSGQMHGSVFLDDQHQVVRFPKCFLN